MAIAPSASTPTTVLPAPPANRQTAAVSASACSHAGAKNVKINSISILQKIRDPNGPLKRSIRPAMDRGDRTSFSSIKEGDSGVAQTFTTSKTSSYLRNRYDAGGVDEEEAIDDGSITPPEDALGVSTTAGTTLLQGYVCPCDTFQGWKSISLGGRMASKSKSFSDLRPLGNRWAWDGQVEAPPAALEAPVAKVRGKYPPGRSQIETLPMELLGTIIDQLSTDIPPNGFTARNIDLMSLLLTSRTMHAATLATLYNHITIPHSRIFRKFLSHVSEHPPLGTIVRRLDFSHFNPTGSGITARERAQTLNLIPQTLLQCLSLTPNLREFLAQEHIDDDLDSEVIQKLLCGLPMLTALDFCACSSTSFRDSFNAVIHASPSPLPAILPITRLSLHECSILDSTIFSALLPRLPHLTHLDVAHTRITNSALFSIPKSARLTHLNLSKCTYLTGPEVVEFLSTHPAAQTLVCLNLAMDIKSHELLGSDDVTALLPVLPSSLRSLNLKGCEMNASHIPLLLPLTKHVEELGLSRNLELADITRLFIPDENLSIEEQVDWIPHTVCYIDVSDLSIDALDLGTLFGMRCLVLKSVTAPLTVLEVSAEVFKKLEKSPAVKRVGWCLKDAGRRYWLVRIQEDGQPFDDGLRDWKWGASYWGMRKIPVARAEVGGMYGHYMFKR
ncbi:RNI-like protein [Venustampulla echinocandica]|uniref:RNI-like protein n=1 Tax=Venustampulla echinocandica TaxID=2656787 RepID=A0A370U032_9HELO|nr:RNI-like protein [Venustampulla echinocandica]RDL41128.1 RNI-like protein [Venustampulla echinocandica]